MTLLYFMSMIKFQNQVAISTFFIHHTSHLLNDIVCKCTELQNADFISSWCRVARNACRAVGEEAFGELWTVEVDPMIGHPNDKCQQEG